MPDMSAKLERARALLHGERAALETLIANGVLVVIIALLATAATRRLARVKEADAKVEAVHAALKNWAARYQAPNEYERQSWHGAAADLERLGVKPEERLYLAQLLARRAEDAGIGDARVKFTATTSQEVRAAGSRLFRASAYGARVEFDGSFAAGVEFIAQLPAAVSITDLSMQRSGGGVKMQFGLQVFEPTAGAQ